jgi:hypothetical protein
MADKEQYFQVFNTTIGGEYLVYTFTFLIFYRLKFRFKIAVTVAKNLFPVVFYLEPSWPFTFSFTNKTFK